MGMTLTLLRIAILECTVRALNHPESDMYRENEMKESDYNESGIEDQSYQYSVTFAC